MANKRQYGRQAQLSYTTSKWMSDYSDVVLYKGEIGIETDTRKIKIGDGSTTWENLLYANPDIPIATSISSTSTNDNVASPKAVFDYASPSSTSGMIIPHNYNTTVVPDDCVFNFTKPDDNKGNGYESKHFIATFTSPITGNLQNGIIEVEEMKNGNGNFYFRQRFWMVQQSSYNATYEYFRLGSVRNNTNINFSNIYEQRSLINWEYWYPLFYPETTLTMDNEDFSVASISYCVTSGVITIFVNKLKQLVAVPASQVLAVLPSCLKCKNDRGAHGPLFNAGDFTTVGTLTTIASSGNILFRGGTTSGLYYGTLTYVLGY